MSTTRKSLKAKKLRFASIVRVSTEQQEKNGGSLPVQRKDNQKAVVALGGVIVEEYGGHEHATPGWEKKEIERLLQDAKRTPSKYDAVIVSHTDRWSRDNQKSQEGLKVFEKHNIKFFVGQTEYCLSDPEHLLFLEMSTVFGQFQARNQRRKSRSVRIDRAKMGMPSCGKLPFGRMWDKTTGQWSIDDEKKALVEEAAKRYLRGEKLKEVANKYGLNHSFLHKTLTQRCGTVWEQRFRLDDGTYEVIKTEIPSLLPAETINAILKQAKANKTYAHGQFKYKYLLKGLVFCEHCGYKMFGQANHNQRLYYRHAHMERVRECNRPDRVGSIRADVLEEIVLRHLFDTFGNPKKLREAIEEAIPNREEEARNRNRVQVINDTLAKIERERDRVVDRIAKGIITDALAKKNLADADRREAMLLDEKAELEASLESIPRKEDVDRLIKIGRTLHNFPSKQKSRLRQRMRWISHDYDSMSWEDKKALCEMVFSGQTPEGKPMGVSVKWNEDKSWRCIIRGHFINMIVREQTIEDLDRYFEEGYTPAQNLQNKLVSKYAWH